MRLPDLVAAADWSVDDGRRRIAIATLAPDGSYLADSPEAVGPPRDLIPRLRKRVGQQGVVLLGLDFPIGLPSAYAAKAGIVKFRDTLPLLGEREPWLDFFSPTDTPSLARPFGPATNPAGGLTRTGLAKRLGLAPVELLRQCDRKTPRRQQAESLFYTRFARQVGRAAAHGWANALQPHASSIRLWPFDGSLAAVLNEAGVVVAEIYPAEAAAQLRLSIGPGTTRSKARQADRAFTADQLGAMARQAGLHFTPEAFAAVASGFETADDFDAAIALTAMISILRSPSESDPPAEESIHRIEGWMLGLVAVDRSRDAPRASVALGQFAQGRARPYYIHRFRWGPELQESVELAHPTDDLRGAVNVLCGLNNVGKTFLLDQIRRLLQQRAHSPQFEIEPAPRSRPRLLVLGRAWDAKDRIGVINLEQRRSALDLPQNLGDYRRIGLTLLASHIAAHVPGIPPDEAVSRLASPEVRQQIAAAFPPEVEIFRCRPDPLVLRLEDLLGASLYFRCAQRDANGSAWRFEFVLLDAGGLTTPYPEWSEGQKACFCIMASLDIARPDIVLFDEVENHLHPGYMTQILAALRAYPAQSLVVTHHPHLIFSQFVDRVFSIETSRPGRHPSPPQSTRYSKHRSDAPFRREAHLLTDDLERITAAYGLFADYDNVLLRADIDAKSNATLSLFNALDRLFDSHVAGPTARPLPDTQTQQLTNLIRTVVSGDKVATVSILDLGAGVGRQVLELRKLSEWQIGSRVNWTCYEPFEALRVRLERELRGVQGVRIISSLKEILGQKFDLCVLANVLHELTPPEIAAYFAAADAYADFTRGGVVILELFPLRRPEGLAVPYDSGLLRDALDACGFATDASVTPLRVPGVTAHWVAARRQASGPSPSREILDQQIEQLWQRTLDRALSAYALGQSPTNVESHQRLLSNLTTIASIAAWRSGRWTPRVADDLSPA